jgi:hypothetical protein
LTERIRKEGITSAIKVDNDFLILDGMERLSIAKSLGIQKAPVIRYPNLPEPLKKQMVKEENALRKQLTWEQVRDRISKLDIRTGPGRPSNEENRTGVLITQKEAADELGVSTRTIRRHTASKTKSESRPKKMKPIPEKPTFVGAYFL